MQAGRRRWKYGRLLHNREELVHRDPIESRCGGALFFVKVQP